MLVCFLSLRQFTVSKISVHILVISTSYAFITVGGKLAFVMCLVENYFSEHDHICIFPVFPHAPDLL
uniref:Uncharacterized protein n=1 Tax=Oryza brachyantha TaxID=4533 RepID=J3MQ78_ORYBR